MMKGRRTNYLNLAFIIDDSINHGKGKREKNKPHCKLHAAKRFVAVTFRFECLSDYHTISK